MKQKLFILFAMTIALISCNKKEEVENTQQEQTQEQIGSYVGVGVVDGDYRMENLKIDFLKSDSIEGAYQLNLYQAQFAANMPVKLDIIIDGLKYENNTLTGNNIVPYAIMQGVRMPYQRYIVTNLKFTTADNQLKGSLNFGLYEVTYEGKK